MLEDCVVFLVLRVGERWETGCVCDATVHVIGVCHNSRHDALTVLPQI